MKANLTFGSLFAGIGGFDLGFERAGMDCKWQVEIDPYCQKVLAKHWPSVRRHDDVRTWPQSDTERVEVICGGFPCQDISNAGKREGIHGERSGLFFEAMRIIRELQPRIVVLENVAAMLAARGIGNVLGELAASGYDAEWECLPASAFGAPHIRDRVFILAYTNGDDGSAFGKSLIQRGATNRTRTAGEQPPSVAYTNGARLEKRQGKRSNTRSQFAAIERNSWWEPEPDVGRVADGIPRRVDRLRGLGNAVVPQIAEWIGRQIVENLEQS